LRAALSIARLRRDHGRRAAALVSSSLSTADLPRASITPDLKEAKTLLGELDP
jgi:hypothetical protein